MIKNTISLIISSSELAKFVEEKIVFLKKRLEENRIERQDVTCSYSYLASYQMDQIYLRSISKEEVFLKLLQKFPENKHELFLDDLEYYKVLEALPDVGR